MAFRPTQYLIEGELDNTHLGKVTGWMRFAGIREKVTLCLEGDFHRDIRGAKIQFKGDAYEDQADIDGSEYLDGFAIRQTGRTGDITAGLPPQDYGNRPYIEIYSDQNGRIVIQLEPVQIKVIGTPIPACESDPVSRKEQAENMARFLCETAVELGIPEQQAVSAGDTLAVERAKKILANDRIRGMKLLPKEVRENLPTLYAQDGKGGKAVVYVKYFTPSSSWTWLAVGGEPVLSDSGAEVDFRFFGLVFGHEREFGYFLLSELEEVRGPMGLPIERDLWWKPKTLEEIAPEMFKSDKAAG